ncbi:pentapeptide repeat-containing protein [Rothia dentocariosa]|uniref:pentapeptide repeat-containing protein n=1 Tax=Rothia dentocariosa TaxID=2047 RepID=UPI00242BA83F|nr:pentapeptide repeat-containing protein [Rothia dentocariosa]
MTETPRDIEETNATNPIGKTEKFVSKHFVRLLVWLAVSGGALAVFGPWLLYVAGWTSETDKDLRLHILYITGGTIAVLGLVETHRKNTTDRIKAEADIQNYQASQNYQSKTLDEQARQFTKNISKEREKIEADKAKNEQDHIRQVHAERRSRYTTAIEQLSSDKASIRLGGVYTLVGLVDEWLTDEKTIPNIEERRKEGQVIINNLCAYIRSPFLLAERAEQLDKPYAKDLQKDFAGDKDKFDADKRVFAQEKATLEEERQIRQSIIKEMLEHLSKNYSKSGPWSDLDYDFSHAHFFYPVNFNNSYFGTSIVNFSRATFTQDANFFGATFAWASFFRATFAWASFFRATFTQDADFFGAKFTERADFIGATFTQDADFIGAKFTKRADFSRAIFHSEPSFTDVLGKARFSHKVAPESYSFGVDPDSPCKIEIEEQEHNGTKFIIPKGTILFDPNELSEQEDNNSNDS